MHKTVTIYHNPRCSKSREAVSLVQDLKGSGKLNTEVEVVKYLEHPLKYSELSLLCKQLNINPYELIRTGEKVFKEHFKSVDKTDTDWIQAMVDYPILIQRPIVVFNNKATVGRPSENILKLLHEK